MQKMKKILTLMFVLLFSNASFASYILIPMDHESQKEHLKAYGITYWVLEKGQKAKWLLNYRGGSFLLPDTPEIQKECQIRNVSFEVLSDSRTEQIIQEIASPSRNMDADRKSTRLNSSHVAISYAVFCLKKKKNK